MQIARQFGYTTDKPIRKAIMSGELKATRSPCRRKLVVAESELLRWITLDLAFEPDQRDTEAPNAPSRRAGPARRRAAMPRLNYDARTLRT